jgi:hypothetical protein
LLWQPGRLRMQKATLNPSLAPGQQGRGSVRSWPSQTTEERTEVRVYRRLLVVWTGKERVTLSRGPRSQNK